MRNGASWSQQAYLKASNAGGEDTFGQSVSVSGDTVVVSAAGEDSKAKGAEGDQADNGAPNAGAAYVFVRSDTSWSQHAYLKASNTGAYDVLGESAAVSGDTLVVGAAGEDSGSDVVNGNQADNSVEGAGAAYVIDLDLDPWTDLGSALAGSAGVPWLTGTGTPSVDSISQLLLTDSKPSSPATLVFGLSQLEAPFKGGTLVPQPLLLVPVETSPMGSVRVPFRLSPGVPAGTALYFQFWISDPGADAGFAASNGLKGTSA